MMLSVILFSVILIHNVESTWVIDSPSNFSLDHVSPHYVYLGKHTPFNATGFFAIGLDPYGCSPVTDGSSIGKIVIVVTGNCNDADKARNVQKSGGIGMISLDYVQNSLKTPSKFYKSEDVQIPCVSVYIPTSQLSAVIANMYSCGGNCTGYISSDAYNVSLDGFWNFISVFFIAGYAINILFSVKKLLEMRHTDLISKFGLPQLVLYTSILISVINILGNIDPSSAGRGIWSSEVYASLLTLAWPFTMGCSLAMSFHWQEFTLSVTRPQEKKTVFAIKERPLIILFWIVFSTLFFINLIITSLRATYLTNFGLVLIFNTVIYMVCVLCISIFFLVTGTKVYTLLRSATGHSSNVEVNKKKTNALRRMNTIRILCGVFWFGFFFCCIAITVTVSAAPLGSYLTSYFFWLFFLYCVDTCHIHFFNTSGYAKSPNNSTKDNKTTTVSGADLPRSPSNADTTRAKSDFNSDMRDNGDSILSREGGSYELVNAKFTNEKEIEAVKIMVEEEVTQDSNSKIERDSTASDASISP